MKRKEGGGGKEREEGALSVRTSVRTTAILLITFHEVAVSMHLF